MLQLVPWENGEMEFGYGNCHGGEVCSFGSKRNIINILNSSDLLDHREAFLSAHEGWGLTVLLGIHSSPKLLPIHPMELFDGRRIIGSVFGGFKGKSQLPHFARECIHGVVRLDNFITHELPFEEINKAFDLLTNGKSLRCIMNMEDWY
ncbi:hypothetical protein Lal_00025243 [Lupinus albus]|nr:hypothetical protein Lal_00025243 [Lupinus albus]